MKKKAGIIIAVVILITGILAFVKGKEYYENTYVAKTYYGQIPSTQSMELVSEYDSSGKKYEYIDYNFTIYNAEGESALASFNKYDVESAYQPNTYVKVEQSKTRTIYDEEVSREEIPKEVLKYIDENHK